MPTYHTRRVTFAAAHRYRVAGWSDAKNEATRMKETATSGIHKMKLEVFQNDGNAYARVSARLLIEQGGRVVHTPVAVEDHRSCVSDRR